MNERCSPTITPDAATLDRWAHLLEAGAPLYDLFVSHGAQRGVDAIDTLSWYVDQHRTGADRLSRLLDLPAPARAELEIGESEADLPAGLRRAAELLRPSLA
ncbi:MAG: hypothetical protein ACXIVQ_09015 [Acidimicrobiales bacterium]